MKKIYFVLIAITFGVQGLTQNLLERVPASAEMVFSIDGKKLTDKIGETKIKKSEAFLKFTQELIFRGNNESRVDDIGIDIESGLVFFFAADTAVEYMAYLYGIEEPKLFEKYIKENDVNGTIENHDQYKVFIYENNYELIAWNDTYAIYIMIDYLHEDLQPLDGDYYDIYSWIYEYDGSSEATEYGVTEAIDETETPAELTTCDDGSGEVEVEAEYSIEDEAILDSLKHERDLARQKMIDERREKLHKFYGTLLNPYFSKNPAENILSNKNYIKGKNPNADLHFYVTQRDVNLSYFGFYDYYYSGRRYYRNFMRSMDNYFGESMSINGLFEDEKITLLADIQYDPVISGYFEEMYTTKISEKLMQYVNSDNFLAISSFSLSAEKMWKNYPKIYAKFYEKMFSRREDYSEEIAVMLDFIEIFIDEKALADIATGDMLFILKDLSEVEVTYQTYEYNEDYTIREEVEKTRKEMYPQFIALFTTNNKIFLEKLLNLAVKQEMLYHENQCYYTLENEGKMPFQIGFTIQNGVAIISTDMDEIKSFSEGKTYHTAPKDLYAKMAENQNYMAVNIQEILNNIPESEMNKKELEMLEYSRKNTRKMESFSKFKDGIFHINVDIEIPSKSKNSADYLWNFMDEMYAIGNK